MRRRGGVVLYEPDVSPHVGGLGAALLGSAEGQRGPVAGVPGGGAGGRLQGGLA